MTNSRTVPACACAALSYAQQGLPVFPVSGKVPFRGTHGFKEATVNATTITAWWKRWPLANVAIPTGLRSGWLVVDIDARHDGFLSLQQLEAMVHQNAVPLSQTRSARTGGGGLHLFYHYPALPISIRNTVEVAGLPGIDVRGEGGYVVVAPSRHPSGGLYEWINEDDVCAPPPAVLMDLLDPQRRRPLQRPISMVKPQGSDPRSEAAYWLAIALRHARPGARHYWALFLACRLVEYGIPQAEQVMCDYVACVPGGGDEYSLADALGCLRWASLHVSSNYLRL